MKGNRQVSIVKVPKPLRPSSLSKSQNSVESEKFLADKAREIEDMEISIQQQKQRIQEHRALKAVTLKSARARDFINQAFECYKDAVVEPDNSFRFLDQENIDAANLP